MLSNYSKTIILETIFGLSIPSPSSLFIGLEEGISDFGVYIEASYPSYERKPLSFLKSSYSAIQSNDIIFETIDGATNKLDSLGIYDSISGGNRIGFISSIFPNLSSSDIGSMVYIKEGYIEISFSDLNISDYLRNILINYFLGIDITPQSNLHLCLCYSKPTPNQDGSTIPEFFTDNYERVPLGIMSEAESGIFGNESDIIFQSPTKTWNSAGYFAITNQLVGGDLLFFGELSPHITAEVGDPVTILGNTLRIGIE